mgnify:CR=1 FL=1
MLQGKQLILATKPFMKEDRFKSWYHTLTTLFILIALLFGTVYNFHWILKLACSIMAGLVIVRLFVIYHDHQHKTILQKSTAADILFTLLSEIDKIGRRFFRRAGGSRNCCCQQAFNFYYNIALTKRNSHESL